MNVYRQSCSLGPFLEVHRQHRSNISAIKLYALYLNDRHPESVQVKALSLYHMKTGWMTLMNIPI